MMGGAIGVLGLWAWFSGWVGMVVWVVVYQWVLWMDVFPALAEHKGKLGIRRGLRHVVLTYGLVCRDKGLPMSRYRFMQRSNDLFGPAMLCWMAAAAVLVAIGSSHPGEALRFAGIAGTALLLAWLLWKWNRHDRALRP